MPDFFGTDITKELYDEIKRGVVNRELPNYEHGKLLVNNYRKYGVSNWKEWADKNWGRVNCKNPYNQFAIENKIYFSTDWNCPFELLKALADLCADFQVSFHGMWAQDGKAGNFYTNDLNSISVTWDNNPSEVAKIQQEIKEMLNYDRKTVEI